MTDDDARNMTKAEQAAHEAAMGNPSRNMTKAERAALTVKQQRDMQNTRPPTPEK